MRLLAPKYLVLICLSAAVSCSASGDESGSGSLNPPNLQPLIAQGNALLGGGQYGEAIRSFSEAIELTPADYVLYYKRATAYYSISRHSQALDDFNRVLELTGGTFDSAYQMQARIHLKEGSYAEAREALASYAAARSSGDMKKTIDELEKDINDSETMTKKAEKEHKAELWSACVESSTEALRSSAWNIKMRETRVECQLRSGDIEGAVGDLTRLSAILPEARTPPIYRQIFVLSYFFLPPSASPASHMHPLKQCLHSDPDSKLCLPLHRLAKAMDKSFAELDKHIAAEDWLSIVQLTTYSGKHRELLSRYDTAYYEHASALSVNWPRTKSPRRLIIIRALCKAYTNSGAGFLRKTEEYCRAVLDGDAEDIDAMIGMGDVHLGKEEWQEAVNVLQKAWDGEGRGRRDIHSRLQKAQKLLKQSKQKDYYKVLGVSRDADAKTIKKAFRSTAKTAHPDKGGSEAKMAALNEAYGVLSDPELKARYDAGDDPNDPTGGYESGGARYGGGGFGGGFDYGSSGHPFEQFFGGGGGSRGGGSNFKFNFGH